MNWESWHDDDTKYLVCFILERFLPCLYPSRAEDLAACMRLLCLCTINQLLHRWRSTLTSEERVHNRLPDPWRWPDLQRQSCKGWTFSPAGPYWVFRSPPGVPWRRGDGLWDSIREPALQGFCHGLNKKKLSGRVDILWWSVLGFNDDIKAEWRVLYTPTINQKSWWPLMEDFTWYHFDFIPWCYTWLSILLQLLFTAPG